MRTATYASRTSLMPPLLLIGAATVLVWAALRAPLIAAGLSYAAIFCAIAWVRPAWALMLTFASAPFQNDLSSGGPARFSLAEINLALCFGCHLLQCLARKERIALGPIGVPVLLYLTVCAFSASQHWLGRDSVVSILQMVLYFVVAGVLFSSFVREPKDFMPALQGLVGVCVFISVAALALRTPFLFGIHKNGIGASLSAGCIVAFELWLSADTAARKRWALLAVLIITAGLISSLSRGAWLATACGVVLILLLRRRLALLINVTLLFLPIIVAAWMLVPSERKAYVTEVSTEKYTSVGARLENAKVAESLFQQDPWFGQGVGLRETLDATNVTLFTLAETGIVGLAAFFLIHLALFRMIWSTRGLLDPAEPAFSLLAIGGALVLGKLVHGQLDHYWSRGALMLAWSSAGMATFAFWHAQRRFRAWTLHTAEAIG